MIIESRRIILRNWEEKDINDLVEGLNNINGSKWMASVPFPYKEQDVKNFIENSKNTNNIEFAIVLKENNKVKSNMLLMNQG